ncbi:hypothetical protein CNR22_18140 [Sphingobacteriaceae bacterium]|nr:hypothetical protein CNR22_18140 [Sphingobacteriaceae bacterium]
MKTILYLGFNPETLDFSQPGFPPGLTAEIIEAGVAAEIKKLKGLGFEVIRFFFDLGNSDLSELEAHLKTTKYDGLLIGAGIRIPPPNLIFFEKLINCLHEHAPHSKIMFNTSPQDSDVAIKRWL